MVSLTVADIVLSTLGGLLISLSTSLHLLLKGRVTGFSGIFYSLISWDRKSLIWKIALVCGLIFTSSILYNIFEFNKVWDNTQIFDSPLIMTGNLDIVGFAIAGFLVGAGTKLSNGCTSGHGVCGLPRFAIRSWLSVGTFLSFAIGIATLKYYAPFLNQNQATSVVNSMNYSASANVFLGISIILLVALLLFIKEEREEILIGFMTGVIFAIGLGFGGMFRRSKIIGFLALTSDWDPSLMFLLGSSVGVNMLTFNYIIHRVKKPLLADKIQIATNNTIDIRLVFGSAIFGIGWGLGGLCPGPAMSLLSIFSIQISIVWLIFLAIGQYSVAFYDMYRLNQLQKVKIQESSQTSDAENMNNIISKQQI